MKCLHQKQKKSFICASYQKTRVCHEYKKNIESKIEKIEDKYNLYGIGFKTDKYNFMIDWNKNNDIFHISIDSNIFINEELINVIIQYIQDSLLVDCSFELDCLNKKLILKPKKEKIMKF